MPAYRVVLNASIQVSYSLEVEAADEDEARQLAKQNAPDDASFWDPNGDGVFDIEAESPEPID